jgi:prevent-host-death family protein
VPQIGVTELKMRASEILRDVRWHKTRYVITDRGHPVGLLTPIEEPETSATATAQQNWDELTRLGQQIAAGWPAGMSSADILSEMKR